MKLYLTNSGQDLLYKAQGGKTLKFSRFGLGDGDLNGQAIQPLISLINQKMSLDLKRLEIKDDKVILGAYLDNKELTEGFYLKEIGIFAIDPDTNEELLYMYGNSGETSDYIDSNTGRVIEENLTVEIYVSNAPNVTATIDESLVFALAKNTYTKEEIDDKFSRLSSAYVFKGSVATESDLPTEGMQVGDVYDIQETNMNVAWNGTEWDDLGGVFEFDLTAYVKREELSKVATSGDYNDLDNLPVIPEVPTTLSSFANDMNFKSVEVSTEDLEAGVSELAEGHIHLTYE